MKKAGILNRIHKGLRTWLFETGIVIQETDFLSADEGMKTITALKKVLQVAERKSGIDETYFLPAMVLQAPFMVSLMDAEIRKTRELTERLFAHIDNYMQPGTENFYAVTGFSIQQVYSEFMGAVLMYMNRLESMLTEMYASGMKDAEIEQLEAAQLMQLEGANRMIISDWVFKGMSNREIDELLNSANLVRNEWFSNELSALAAERRISEGNNRTKRMVAA